MKQFFAALVAVSALMVGCGPAEEGTATEVATATVRQELTPCLSECYSGCSLNSTTAAQVMACRQDCRDYVCAGE